MSKPRRPAQFRAGHMKEHRLELLERANLSRELLAASDLGGSGQAWRLWASCMAATVDNAKAADLTYATTLAETAGIDRTGAGRLLRRFDELGVIGWAAAPKSSRDISELSLPDVTPQAARDASGRTNCADEHHYVTPQAALPISNEALINVSVERAEAYQEDGEPKSPEATDPSRTGTHEWDAPEAMPPVEDLTREELDRQAYRAFTEGDEARLETLRLELHRRAASASALARFGEPEPSSLTDTDAYRARRR